MRPYEFRHTVCFQETNLVGNVYFANHVLWQGKCRELFLRDYAPDLLSQLEQGLSLVTTQVSCEYYQELFAFDEIIVRMYVAAVKQSRVTMRFEYYRLQPDGKEELVARGGQEIACMRNQNGEMAATPIPETLVNALSLFSLN
ncbi:MAG: 4-hydroxybenzoyl-CoA thioesterase [Candidatus Methylumidiphilus alinenensis]|uniref:4-hydroxybenzoyl-CoA thioesterase n=1 Tax=Candidatus Methylumidiphilus alinenensis TaxID=2202197 RepID=A0A2W4QU08_9GAMM|nr:MAG: 4-hydroxybenzoyl-CoA thioesterase [Candidatus Methylumidiphilus alinenensis]